MQVELHYKHTLRQGRI